MISRSLGHDDAMLLHQATLTHCPQFIGLLDLLGQQPLPLAQRSQLDQALLCESLVHGYHHEDEPVARLEVWHLNVCILRHCVLDRHHLDLLRRLIDKHHDSSLLAMLDAADQAQWSEEQRQHLAQHVRHEYREMAGIPERRVMSALGNRVWELRRYVYTSTPLHDDDRILLRETVQKWNPPSVALVDVLATQPPEYDERRRIYDAITAEMQDTGGVRDSELDRLIDYIGFLTRSNKPGEW